jgi:hypothetical protein
VLAITLAMGIAARGAPAMAAGPIETITPTIETAEVFVTDGLTETAWSFAESMEASVRQAAAGTWSTVETVSISVTESVSTTWDQAMRATLIAAPPSGAGTTRERPSMSLLDLVNRGWNYIKGLFGRSASVAAPSSTADWLTQLNEDHQTGFWTLLNDAGYNLKSIDTTIGIIPAVTFQYALSRQLSEADKSWLERKLDRFARDEPGPISVLQRTIIHGILQGNETEGYMVDTVKISLLPLPKASFSMIPDGTR